MKKVAESAVSSTINFVNGIKKRADYHFGEYIENHYLKIFVDLVKKDQNLQWLTDDQIQEVCKKSCELYDTDFDRGGFVGVAIAGYGEEEIYPHLVHLHIAVSYTHLTDWKYNNNYVGKDDKYRHSKWLTFMEDRLRLAKKLLKDVYKRQVTHNGKTWESLADNNVWEPGAIGTESLWKEVA